MATLIPINIIIADRSYRIKIDPADEEVVRKTIKQINEKIIEYKTQFAGKDIQDYISMVLLWFATDLKQHGAGDSSLREITSGLNGLESLLDRSLDKKA